MQKQFLLIASISGALAVMIGAFGAHALRSLLLANDRLETFDTAVKYHFYHTLALIAIAILMYKIDSKALTVAGYSFIIGIVLFSGSLYALCISGITKFGAITPLGGLSFIVGWLALFFSIFKAKL